MRVMECLIVVSIASGCAFDEQPDAEPAGKIAFNTISFADVTANHGSMTELAAKKFSLANSAGAAMASTAGGRQVLEYLVGCAFRKNQSYSITSGDNTYTFQGDIGLAKGWKHGRLSEREQRWVSACMLARVNNQGKLMKISLRGPHHALRVAQGETNKYSLEEGVYYGNIFTGAMPVVGWSCRGAAQANGEGGDGTALSYRDCAEPGGTRQDGLTGSAQNTNQCGWGFAEDCFIHSLGIPNACEKKVTFGGGHDDPDCDGDSSDDPDHGGNAPNTYYKKCHAGGVIPMLEPMWREVITVYVENGPPSVD